MDSIRLFLPIYFTTYLLVCLFWRWTVFYKRTGKSPIVLGAPDTPHGYLAQWLKVIAALVAIEVILYCFNPNIFEYGPLKNWWAPTELRYLGFTSLLLSLGISALAQAQMGKSWRIGFGTSERTEIIRTGLYRHSRNPIYVGMILNLLGLFFILPNTLSLVALVLGHALIQVTVRHEEAHLSALHGREYDEYVAEVRRWI